MKFYKRFPGDINIKTGHLDPAEFGCYDRLLDHYYATEAPIPASGAYSICRAVKPEHRRACDSVLRQFFVLTDAGWEQQRAEEEIADAQPRIEAARANGQKGGRPPKQKPTGFSGETQGEPNGKASQIPDTSSLPSSEKRARKRAVPPVDKPEDVTPEAWGDWTALRRSKRAPVTALVLETARTEAAAAKLTLDQFLRVWVYRGSQGLQADWLTPKDRERVAPAGVTAPAPPESQESIERRRRDAEYEAAMRDPQKRAQMKAIKDAALGAVKGATAAAPLKAAA